MPAYTSGAVLQAKENVVSSQPFFLGGGGNVTQRFPQRESCVTSQKTVAEETKENAAKWHTALPMRRSFNSVYLYLFTFSSQV